MFDTDKFICEVERRPSLYDTQCKDYGDRDIKAKCWVEVAKAMYAEWNSFSDLMKEIKSKDLLKKWKTLRDSFVREYKLINVSSTRQPAKKKKKYTFYDQLEFLIPYIKGNVNATSNTVAEDSDINAPLNKSDNCLAQGVGSEIPASTSSGPLKIKRRKKLAVKRTDEGTKAIFEESIASSAKHLTSILSESLALQKEERQADIYGHKSFMLSYVPMLNALPLRAAMQARRRITDIISSYDFQEDMRHAQSAPDSNHWILPHHINQ